MTCFIVFLVVVLASSYLFLHYINNGTSLPQHFQNSRCTIKGAAEQKARATYEKLIDLCADDPDVVDVLRYLREREVVHFQRFGEALNGVEEKLAEKKFYMKNDCNC